MAGNPQPKVDDDMSAILSRLDHLEKQNESFTNYFSSLKTQVEEKDIEIECLKSDLKKCHSEIKALEYTCNQLKEEFVLLKESKLKARNIDDPFRPNDESAVVVDQMKEVGKCLTPMEIQNPEDDGNGSDTREEEFYGEISYGKECADIKYVLPVDEYEVMPDSPKSFKYETEEETTVGQEPNPSMPEFEGPDCKLLLGRLDENGPQLIQELDASSILPFLEQGMPVDELSLINAEREEINKNSRILDAIKRQLRGSVLCLYTSFLSALAGIHPDAFQVLSGREPTSEEEDGCIQQFCEGLKKSILQQGHQVDSHIDTRINLDKGFVMLKLLSSDASDRSNNEEQIPSDLIGHGYVDKTAESAANIPVRKILLGKKLPAKIILTGRGGIGKTTTIQWLYRKWAIAHWGVDFSLAFMVSLRILTTCDVRITLVELLTTYGLYKTCKEARRHLTGHWLNHHSRKVLLEIDGLDEVRHITKRIEHAPIICDVNDRCHPLDLVVNILRGNLLPQATLIVASRPFLGLKELVKEGELYEIRGLSQKNIRDYIVKTYPKKQSAILEALKGNPIVMSVCAITFYCTVISEVLNDDPTLSTQGIDTYTRLQAFILQKYTSRKVENTTFGLETCKILPKLACLARRGIFDDEMMKSSDDEMMRLVFTEHDLIKVKLDTEDLNKAFRRSFLLETRFESSAHILVEFVHLSVQELLAIANAISESAAIGESVKSKSTFETILNKIKTDGKLSMALLYLFGLFYDTTNHWIDSFLRVVCDRPEVSVPSRKLMDQLLKRMKQSAGTSGDKFQLCQLAHESQSSEIAKFVVDAVVKNNKVNIYSHSMTAVDTKALLFTCKHDQNLRELAITNASLDDLSTQMMCTFINNNVNVTKFDLSHNELQNPGLTSLGNMVAVNYSLKTLVLVNIGITDDKIDHLLQGFELNRTLVHVDLANNLLSDHAAEKLAKLSDFYQRLEGFVLSNNMISHIGANELIKGIGSVKIKDPSGKPLQLKLENNNIVEKEIFFEARFKGPVTLTCGNTDFGKIHSVPKFRSAKTIYLNDAGLGNEAFEKIASNLKGLRELEILVLRGNNLTSGSIAWLDSIALTCPNLQSVDLAGNDLLDEIILAFQYIRSKDADTGKSVEARLQGRPFTMAGTTRLILADEPAADIEALNVVLRKWHGLEKLTIDITGFKEANNGSARIKKAITHTINSKNNLSYLELAGISFELEGQKKSIAKCILSQRGLKSLKISKCSLGANDLRIIGLSKSITDLSIDPKILEPKTFWGNTDVARVHDKSKCLLLGFCKSIRGNRIMEKLRLTNMSMRDNLVELAKVLSENKIELASLYIGKCAISEKGARELGQAISLNTKLRSLEFASNDYESGAATALCKGMENNDQSLINLKLELHLSEDEAFRHLARMLSVNVSLSNLDISCENANGCCRIDDGRAKGLGEALANRHTTVLRTLNLSGNVLTVEGLQNLFTSLKWNESLTTLRLQSTQIADQHMPCLCEYLKSTTSLLHLDIRDNKVKTAAEEFKDAIKQNSSLIELGLPDIQDPNVQFMRVFSTQPDERYRNEFRELIASKNIAAM